MTRPWTPPTKTESGGTRITVKRACERCGRDIGDATRDELDAAIAGAPLPDVAHECGCPHAIEQLALVMQGRDSRDWGYVIDGTHRPTWTEIDPAGQEQYLEDAAIAVRVLAHLGWAPTTREDTP